MHLEVHLLVSTKELMYVVCPAIVFDGVWLLASI